MPKKFGVNDKKEEAL
jgi:colicin import membrane protein